MKSQKFFKRSAVFSMSLVVTLSTVSLFAVSSAVADVQSRQDKGGAPRDLAPLDVMVLVHRGALAPLPVTAPRLEQGR